MKKRSILLGILIGWVVYAAAEYLFPPLTFDFWRLARTDEVAFSAVGMGGRLSFQYVESDRINRSICPRLSFRALFAVGTPAAKCHALVGLRRNDPERFPDYVKRLRAMDDTVTELWMDIGEPAQVSKLATAIEAYKESEICDWQKDFREWWQKKRANQTLHGTPAESPSSSTESEGRRP